MFFGVVVHAGLAVERQIRQTKHVERGQKSADGGHAVQYVVMMGKGMGHDLVFAPKSRERRDPGDGDRADEEQLMGPGNLMAEAAHLPDVLLTR